MRALLTAWLILGVAGLTSAGPADVLSASAKCSADSVCSFAVTVRHADEGWKHYADRWQVLSPDGEVIATRVLRHPHVNEQPFTRRLGKVKVPASLTHVRIRARDSVHGSGGTEVEIPLPRESASSSPH